MADGVPADQGRSEADRQTRAALHPERAALHPERAFRGPGALRYRNYRLYVAGQAVSSIGYWMQGVAQAWLVLQLTGDALMLGVLTAAQFVPTVALGLFGGVLADQVSKRWTLVATHVVATVLSLLLFALAASGLVEVWHILVFAALRGVSTGFESPARHSFPVEMVGRNDVASAVAVNSAVFYGASLVGPAIAGVTIGIVGVAPAFLLNGIGYLVVIASLVVMRGDELMTRAAGPRVQGMRDVLANLGEGLRYVAATPIVLLACVVVALAVACAANFQVLIPVLADEVLAAGASGYGFLMAAAGLGSLAGALGSALALNPAPRYVALGAVALGGASVVLAVSGLYGVSLLAMLVAGAGNVVMSVAANSTIQRTVPASLLGRVMSIYVTGWFAAAPLGGLVFGAIASAAGVAPALGIGGAMALAVGAGAFAWLARIRRSQALRQEIETTLDEVR